MKVKTPAETIGAALEAGCGKASLTCYTSLRRLIGLSVVAGAYIALGGALSFVVGSGFPGVAAANPAFPKLMSALMFPIGLILIVILGGELFTGNNALLMPPVIRKRVSPLRVAANWTIVYLGNAAGAIAFAAIMVRGCDLTSAEPWHSAALRLGEAKCSMPWLTVFVKGIGANWCVCLAVWLALSGHTLIETMAGCFLPVMAFVALGYEHCIANMFFIPLSMMEGAQISIVQFITANLIPATLGNIIGGGLFVGTLFTWLHTRDC
ncbi:MAG: formate/nitrite transporter family protein [Bacteroides sp.]|nr:formate/nitrite transporter family protein [Bacteroides sp.]